MAYNIDNDIAYQELINFHNTKIPSIRLCLIVRKLAYNKLSNKRYCNVTTEDKQDMATQAMIDFIKWGHNFRPKDTYSKGVAVGYLDFNMNNTFNRYLKKLTNQNEREVNTCVDVAYWDTNLTADMET